MIYAISRHATKADSPLALSYSDMRAFGRHGSGASQLRSAFVASRDKGNGAIRVRITFLANVTRCSNDRQRGVKPDNT